MQLLLPPHISGFMQDNGWLLLSVLMNIAQLSSLSTFSHNAGSSDRSRRKTSKVTPDTTIGPRKPTKRSIWLVLPYTPKDEGVS